MQAADWYALGLCVGACLILVIARLVMSGKRAHWQNSVWWKKAYVAVLTILALSQTDTVIRIVTTVTAVCAAYALGRRKPSRQ
ncbi:hypothetical protein ABZ312_44910 [Streptomyces sp. NPDC006207]